MSPGEMLKSLGSAVGGLMFMWAMFPQYFPPQVRDFMEKYCNKLMRIINPYVQIIFPEFTGERLKRSDAYTNIQNYLKENATSRAKRLKADSVDDRDLVILSMDEYEEITEKFQGVKVWWSSNKTMAKNLSFSLYPSPEDRRFFKLTFHKRHRDLITTSYIKHVLVEGKAIAIKNRQRKLYTNNPSKSWHYFNSTKWSHVVFDHPASFDTLALEPKKKQEIMDDLQAFCEGKEYYAKIGKPWKRGYLLYGPPGTGKSTMIAAIANHLDYDVYDLELTAVKNNTDLRKLLIETTSKSIIVIEDIDCSLDLTGQRKKEKDDGEEKKDDPAKKITKEEKNDSKVTLSGLLNFIDGLWSACGGERIIIFTTNHVDKLDPALIRRGRMDMYIELSYCCFEAFKVLANNYLGVEDHELFTQISQLLEETNMTPADVAENLMPKFKGQDVETRLRKLIEALEKSKEEARKNAEEEVCLKAEKEEQEKKVVEDKDETEKHDGLCAKEIGENGVANGKKESGEAKENGES